MNSAVMFSKASDEWSTPQDFYDALHEKFGFAVRPGIELRFVKGRLKFGGAPNGAPFPSMVVVFRP